MENNNESGESTPISDRSEPNSVNYGSVDDVDNLPSTTIVVDAENSENNNNPENNKKSIKEYMKQFHYKKISLDPQATLYVFTLKYIFTFLLLGQIFMIAVALIANTEDAVEYYIVKKDVHSCNTTLNNNNETACLSLKPYCNYVNLSLASSLDSKNSRSSKLRSSNTFSTTKRGKSMLLAINNNVEVVGQCLPVALRGIYDFSVKNIRPSSTNWYYVALLDSAYVLLFTFLFYLFVVKKMHPYIQRVLREQIRNALGYKVVCVRGLEEEDMSSKELFKQRFLSEEAYFGEEDLPQASKNKRARAIHEDGHDYYEFMDCNGFNCLFSTFMCRYYVSSRENATFTKKNKVRQIFFSRRSPPNMYDIIHATEKSMGQLQEWVAREKAERRRLSFFSQNNNHHHHNENEEYLLETRRCIPHCLETEKAVPHYIEQFTHDAKLLNAYIEKVPLEKKNGVVYIVFDDALAAFEFINFFSMKYGGWHSNATVSLAGPPGHLIENNIKASKVALLVRFLCLFLFYVVLLFTWSIPVGFVSSIDNLASIPTVGNIFYKYYTDEVPTVIRNFITTFLPVVMLGLFNIILPFLIRFIVLLMGAINKKRMRWGSFVFAICVYDSDGGVVPGAVSGFYEPSPRLDPTQQRRQT
ncbi:hypothetical protein AGDE_16688 [Angomonas deanei]|uniref:Calcium-dependent channel, 7TM region, putative phosphate, putative n=1 Tax=Angomonas deanei TaxID=59799 RepID=A0A7G2CJ87_9TRYP|nr:hypothetical protein AGDE_16688 [Angomonas deanei]CAD2219469.1 Calcium-dependent channel, 7TM region, putative phosphate, putative [Angomonas deanei]|eukprot:EPY16614.1 hypothetical protein AGDE_16688 [Angomonas deanei]